MSVAVAHHIHCGDTSVDRKTIRPLLAWAFDLRSTEVLPPGTSLSSCRLLHIETPGAEPYQMEFEFAGRQFSCPLYAFQSRTQPVPVNDAVLAGER